MNTFEKIENDINKIKDWNIHAGNMLHEQMNRAQHAQWTREDLSQLIKSDQDVADMFYSDGEPRHDEIRDIQDSIINFYSE